MRSSLPIPELLAPAGSPDALHAAVSNGADAVYLGIDRLNARRGAQNFTLETLPEACAYAHLHGARVYLTANILILPDEMADALEVVDAAWAAGVDAVIVQDLGLMRCVRESLPHVRVHASTQVNAHSTRTIAALRDLGVSRVTLSREVSVAELRGFVAGVPDVEIESFVHGALCMCYSGQCLMSSLIGGRSANRGLCAQPCRLPYALIGDGREIETPGAYLLSPRDLAGIGILPDMVASGISALKIEGRMKSAEYVALVTGVYRKALDRLAADAEGFTVRDGEREVLGEAFSRGFSAAYLADERGNDMMSYTRPNNRGVLVGRIAETEPGRATLTLERQVAAEDTIEFWTRSGRFAQSVGPLEVKGTPAHSAPAGARATISVDRPVSAGDRVFRVVNDSLLAAARRTFADGGPLRPLDIAVRVVVGEPLRVEVTDAAGVSGAAEGPVVEPARTKAVSAEEIAEHVGRLGGTGYSAGAWDISLSPGAGVGFSVLHRVRREALAQLEAHLLSPWADRARVAPVLPQVRRARLVQAAPRLVAAADSLDIARVALEAGADEVHVPTWALGGGEVPAGIVPVLPRIAHDREALAALRRVIAGHSAVAGTLGGLTDAVEAGARVAAHWSLNAANAWAAEALSDMGAAEVWLSPELTESQVRTTLAACPVPAGLAIAGRQEIMVTEHCVLMAEGPCDGACAQCVRRGRVSVLRDRKGYEFPVRTDVTGRTHIYNAVPLDLVRALPAIVDAGASALRVDLDTESAQSAAALVRRVRTALDTVLAGGEVSTQQPRDTTTGHFFRGVL